MRILLPWFDRRALLGLRMPSREREAAAASEEYDAAKDALAARPPYSGGGLEVEPLPPEIADVAAPLPGPGRGSPRDDRRPRRQREDRALRVSLPESLRSI